MIRNRDAFLYVRRTFLGRNQIVMDPFEIVEAKGPLWRHSFATYDNKGGGVSDAEKKKTTG